MTQIRQILISNYPSNQCHPCSIFLLSSYIYPYLSVKSVPFAFHYNVVLMHFYRGMGAAPEQIGQGQHGRSEIAVYRHLVHFVQR